MYIKLSVISIILYNSIVMGLNHDWDLAVVINGQIELLNSNGTPVEGVAMPPFNKLKALTFDNVRHQFVVSDMVQNKDTIFTVQLTNETDISPIVQDLPDDVQGLAIDPISDTLYWTDSINGTINYISLNDTVKETKIFIDYKYQQPQHIAIDICRRYIYWTNPNDKTSTIERAKLDGTGHEVLIDTDLHRPGGLAIDYRSQRLYWADRREGIYYRIESTNLDGKERETIFEGAHAKPYGVAVDDQSIYWTDTNNNALWKIEKYKNTPEKLKQFNEHPMGIIAKNIEITQLPDCVNLAQAIKNYNESVTEDYVEDFIETKDNGDTSIIECLNGGKLVDGDCKCFRGFTGKYCEITLCHNFCVHGGCYLSSRGYPRCHCPTGFDGSRCERDMCDGFCLNDGECTYSYQNRITKCHCPDGFVGVRCETSLEEANLCELFCTDKDDDVLYSRTHNFICRCNGGSYQVIKSTNTSVAEMFFNNEHQYLINHLQDPAFLILSCVLLIMLVVLISLTAFTCSLKRRPRIKKRIIVNKNVTPLTYRPQPTSEQCEITIEDCCNMNVCETPCFEPPQLRGIKRNNDDKKNLLSNMENGEELY